MDKKRAEQGNGAPNLDSIQRVLAKERAQYDAKKEAFEGLEEKLEGEFRSGLDASLSDEEREVMELDGDVGAQYDLIMAKRQSFITDKLSDEKAELEAFEEALEKKEMQLDDLRAEAAFKETHPDLDEEGFVAFLKGKITPDDREEFIKASEGDKAKFLGLVAEKFIESTGGVKEEDVVLPSDISNIAGATGDIDNGDELAQDEDSFATDSGLYR